MVAHNETRVSVCRRKILLRVKEVVLQLASLHIRYHIFSETFDLCNHLPPPFYFWIFYVCAVHRHILEIGIFQTDTNAVLGTSTYPLTCDEIFLSIFLAIFLATCLVAFVTGR